VDPLLPPEQLSLVERKLASLARPVVLEFDAGRDPEDLLARALSKLLEELVSVAGAGLAIRRQPAAAHPGRASITVENIQYLALPAGLELPPFLELLVGLSRRPVGLETPEVDPSGASPLAPAAIEVLIAPTCPSCPQVVAVCTELAIEIPALQVTVIDAQLHPELAGSCSSVPTVIVDGARTIVGQLGKQELRELLAERGSPGYLQATLGSMLQAGRFEAAVPLLGSEAGFAAAAELMRGGAMQDRLGLLLLVERVLEGNPHALDAALPFLLPLLEASDTALRGDAADLLGKIGAPGAHEALTGLLSDENPDVREIAEEAIASLRSPS
jgi:alkyl hydroperoxide reductase subunit AhpF